MTFDLDLQRKQTNKWMVGASENCRTHTRSDKSLSKKEGINKDLESINALFKADSVKVYEHVD
jgi:hypothetical protein